MTTKQISFLKRLAARHFADDEDYRCWLQHLFPRQRWKKPTRPSCTDLSTSQGITAIDDLKARVGGVPAPANHRGRYHGAGEPGFAWKLTPDQADEIARHQDLLGWTAPELARFIERQTKKPLLVSALTKRQAGKVITGMKRVLDSRADATPSTGERAAPRAKRA